MPSSTVENYLKTLYLQQQKSGGKLVAMGRLADAMAVSPGTATSMVKSLANAELVIYEPREGSRLTDSGRHLALRVLRRHRLVELFLVQTLGLDWSEVHVEAERLEHAISDKVLERLDDFLDHPTVDPHGDPIPTSAGEMPTVTHVPLSSCEPGRDLRIARVQDQSVSFLRFLDSHGLGLGTELTVVSRDTAADAVTLQPLDGQPVTLGSTAAAKILVDPVSTIALRADS